MEAIVWRACRVGSGRGMRGHISVRVQVVRLLQAVVGSLSSLATSIQLDGRKMFLKNVEGIPIT